jgi:hypothetical protein
MWCPLRERAFIPGVDNEHAVRCNRQGAGGSRLQSRQGRSDRNTKEDGGLGGVAAGPCYTLARLILDPGNSSPMVNRSIAVCGGVRMRVAPVRLFLAASIFSFSCEYF